MGQPVRILFVGALNSLWRKVTGFSRSCRGVKGCDEARKDLRGIVYEFLGQHGRIVAIAGSA
jgi:hypothetical protein